MGLSLVIGCVVRTLDCCLAHRWFEANPRATVKTLGYSPNISKLVPVGITLEIVVARTKPKMTRLSNRHSP